MKMNTLEWDETDFVWLLETSPHVEDYDTEYNFKVLKDNLKLSVTVWQYESTVSLELYEDGATEPTVAFALIVREGIRLVKEKKQEYLHFRNCFLAPTRFSYIDYEVNLKDVEKVPFGFDVHLFVKPAIQIKFWS